MTTGEIEYGLAFPRLTEDEVEALAGLATSVEFRDGDRLFAAGDRGHPLFVVESGRIELVDESSDDDRVIASHGPGGFTGDVAMLSDRPAVVSAYARDSCRARRVAADDLRRVIRELPDLSDKLIEAFQIRRTLLERSGHVGVRVFGAMDDPELNSLREFFDKNRVPHTWIDSGEEAGRALMARHGIEPDQLPFVLCSRGTRSPKPTVTRIAECLGLKRLIRAEPFDLVIVGAGPSGLAAAVYGASEGLSTLVLDRFGPGGQAGTSSKIENYMGFPAGLTGADLANRGYLQALKFGAELVAPVAVRRLERLDGLHVLTLDDGQLVRARTVLIATGASYQRLPVADASRWDGAGVYYSCTTVHARRCRAQRAAVIGGGNSAGQAAMFLAEHTAGATLVLRGGDIRKSMSDYLARRIESHPKIEVLREIAVEAIRGETSFKGLTLRQVPTGERLDLECPAAFVFIGARPRTDWLPEGVATDAKGFILTGAEAAQSGRWPLDDREPCAVETTSPGVFAAGDVRSSSTKRVAFAVGDGALAVTCAHRVLAGI